MKQLSALLNIVYPIIQAPMAGGYTTPELIAKVSNAGGLGSLGAAYMQPTALQEAIKKIRTLTDKPFNVNLFIPEPYSVTQKRIEQIREKLAQICAGFLQPLPLTVPPYMPSFAEQMQIVLEEQVPIFSFTYGALSTRWIKKLKKNNTLLIGTVTSLEEAELLADSSIDIIVAQGSEAGGHRGTFLNKEEDALLGVTELIKLLKPKINKPLVAAGGIMDGEAIAAMAKLGADGVQMGTAFLTCPEAGTPVAYKELLINIRQDITVLTKVFSGKLARGLRNKFIDELSVYPQAILDFPVQNALTRPIREKATQLNLTDYMSLWAGQKAYLSRGMAADQLIDQLQQEMQVL